jgi:hypothetical protein
LFYVLLSNHLTQFFFFFFGVSEPPPSAVIPEAPPNPLTAAGPSQAVLGLPLKANHHPYHLTLVPIIGIAVTAAALVMLIVLIFLIRRKNREIEESENINKTFSRAFPPPRPSRKFQGVILGFLGYVLSSCWCSLKLQISFINS